MRPRILSPVKTEAGAAAPETAGAGAGAAGALMIRASIGVAAYDAVMLGLHRIRGRRATQLSVAGSTPIPPESLLA